MSKVEKRKSAPKASTPEQDEYESVVVRNTNYFRSFENAYHEKTPWYKDKNSLKVVTMGTFTFLFCLMEIIVGIVVPYFIEFLFKVTAIFDCLTTFQ